MTILTVTELTAAIKGLLEPAFRSISVKGEISNFKQQSSGHLYFSLKDAGSQISGVLFRADASRLPRLPKEGDQVIALGEISLYAPRGQYQIIIRELQFLGIGELLIKFHQLKELLKSRGWFDPSVKKSLPKFPKKIGIVTSPTGAVIRDMLHVLKRRYSGIHILLNPVKVQGEGAAQEIARAIEELNQFGECDLLIVGRGGGSIEDLWAFNEEIVAKAIFESKIPVISAVGHETDVTISDWVADVRAPTPSAAAELAVQEKAGLLKNIFESRKIGQARITQRIAQEKQRIGLLKRHPLFGSPHRIFSQQIQQLDASKSALDLLRPSHRIEQWKQKFAPFSTKMETAAKKDLREKKERLTRIWNHLRSLDPRNLLQKGYSILFFENQPSVILSVNELKPEQPFTALMHDGSVKAKVIHLEKS